MKGSGCLCLYGKVKACICNEGVWVVWEDSTKGKQIQDLNSWKDCGKSATKFEQYIPQESPKKATHRYI